MKILVCVALTLCCFVIAPAQERVMEKAEFESLVTGGYAHPSKWKGEKYRKTLITSTKVFGLLQTPDRSSKTIIEYGPGTDSRSISNSVVGDKPNHVEQTLRVGNWVYRRSGDKPWTRKEYAAPQAAERPESPVEVIEANAEYQYLGPGLLKDKPVYIYVKTERRTTVSKSGGDTRETDSKTTYWIGADGMILKHEYTAESRGPKFTSQTVVIMQYELDPSISFAAPEIVP